MTLVVSPAYGRDYKTAKEALADWEKGKDFKIQGPPVFCGTYCSIRDSNKFEAVEIRFKKLTELVIWQPTAK